MKLTTFQREIAVAPVHPVLGTDAAPTAPVPGALPSNYIPLLYGDRYPIQSIVMGYTYTGAGVAPTIEVGVYVYDEEGEQWWLIDSVDLANGQLQALNIPVSHEFKSRRLVVCLVPVTAGGEPNGVYAFAMGGSKNEASVALALGTLATEATQLSIDNAASAILTAVQGTLLASLTLSQSRVLVLDGAGSVTAATFGILTEGPCDGIECDTAEVIVFGELEQGSSLVSVDPADWTVGAGWSNVGTVFTHAAGGGVADLSLAPFIEDRMQLHNPYCILWEMAGRTAGTLTDKLGTAGATARAADGQFLQCLIPTVSSDIVFTPTNDFDGSVDIADIRIFQGFRIPSKNVAKVISLKSVIGVALQSAPAVLVASPAAAIPAVRALWYRS
jgi:hypothetical protein